MLVSMSSCWPHACAHAYATRCDANIECGVIAITRHVSRACTRPARHPERVVRHRMAAQEQRAGAAARLDDTNKYLHKDAAENGAYIRPTEGLFRAYTHCSKYRYFASTAGKKCAHACPCSAALHGSVFFLTHTSLCHNGLQTGGHCCGDTQA